MKQKEVKEQILEECKNLEILLNGIDEKEIKYLTKEEVDNLLNLVDIKSKKVESKELKFKKKEEFLMQEEIDKFLNY